MAFIIVKMTKEEEARQRAKEKEDKEENELIQLTQYLANEYSDRFKQFCQKRGELHAFYHFRGNETGMIGLEYSLFYTDVLSSYTHCIIDRNEAQVIKDKRDEIEKEFNRICDKMKQIPSRLWTECIDGCYCTKIPIVK